MPPRPNTVKKGRGPQCGCAARLADARGWRGDPVRPSPAGASAECGFSLLEMLLAMSLLLLISAIAFGFYGRYAQRYSVEMESSNLSAAGDRAIGTITADLRMAGYPPAPAASAFELYLYPTVNNTPYDGVSDNIVARGFDLPSPNMTASAATFEAALGNQGTLTSGQTGPVVDQVEYALSPMPTVEVSGCATNPQYSAGTFWELERTVWVKSSSGGLGTAQNTSVLKQVFSANGSAPNMFTYLDANGQVTTQPQDVAEVVVKFTLQTCGADQFNHMPVQLSFSGDAFVRNVGK